MLKAFMVMTDMTTSKDEDIKSKLATKQRMVFATMRSVNPYSLQIVTGKLSIIY